MSLGFMSFSDAFCYLNLSKSTSSHSAALRNSCWIQWMLQSICVSHTVKSRYPILPLSNPSEISLPGPGCALARHSHSQRGKILRKSKICPQRRGRQRQGRVPVSFAASKPPLKDGAGCKGWCWTTPTFLPTHRPSAELFANSIWVQKGFFPSSEVVLYELLVLTFSLNYLQKHWRQERGWLDDGNHNFDLRAKGNPFP